MEKIKPYLVYTGKLFLFCVGQGDPSFNPKEMKEKIKQCLLYAGGACLFFLFCAVFFQDTEAYEESNAINELEKLEKSDFVFGHTTNNFDHTPRVFIDAGHGGGDPGARYQDLNEANLMRDLALDIKKKNSSLELIAMDGDSNEAMLDMMNRGEENDFIISLHLNSSYTADSYGVECYHSGEKEAMKLADKICKSISDATGQYNRGAKYKKDLWITRVKPNGVLIELGFLSNTKEREIMLSSWDVYSDIIAEAIKE